jgi:DNA mismatch repair protein PMS2
VVVELSSAVKELVENGIDAGAKNIGTYFLFSYMAGLDIKFHNYGLNGFEVVDDGTGIKEVDFNIIAKRGTTSKIKEFDDIYKIKSLGFRGEALSAICSVSNMVI